MLSLCYHITRVKIWVLTIANVGHLLDDPTFYHQLIGRLIDLTITRPEIDYSVHTLSLFMNKP